MRNRPLSAFWLLCVSAVLGMAALALPTPEDVRRVGPATSAVGQVLDREGVATRRAAQARSAGPIEIGDRLAVGDGLEVGTRGANALRVRLGGGAELTLGPGTLVELQDLGVVRLLRGELEVDASGKVSGVTLAGPDGAFHNIAGGDPKIVFRATEEVGLSRLAETPGWLIGYQSDTSTEALGSLLAQVDGRDVALSMGYHKVTVDIRDQIARTVIEESFVNHTGAILEGVFYFPLPADASISGFGMWINGELVQGDIVEKERAREIYETILRERRDPGLLEWTGGNLFKARVFPIRGEKRIRISYTQVLRRFGDEFKYRYALQSEMLRENPLSRLEIAVHLNSAETIESVSSQSHTCRVEQTDHAASVLFTEEDYTPERDFEVSVRLLPRDRTVTVIPHRRSDDGYFMLRIDGPKIQPPGGETARGPVDLLILADTSGSAWGEDRRQQIAAIEALISGLGDGDTFNLATCDIETRWLSDLALPAGPDARERALLFLEDRDPLGWSDLKKGFVSAFERAAKSTHIVYVGDGVATAGAADPVELKMELAREYLGGGVIHSVIPGSNSEMALLRGLAALGDGGSVRSIGAGADAAQTAFQLLEEIRSPAMKNVTVSFEGLSVAAVYPERLPNLPAGGQHVVVGRFDPTHGAQAGRVRCSGTIDGEVHELVTDVVLDIGLGDDDQDPEDGDLSGGALENAFIPRLWARHHLDHLLDQGSSDRVRERIVALSEDYQIISPYTSFLVLETEEDRKRFGVRRQFRMRDGEAFFTEGRDAANHELTQAQMQRSKGWRRDLREQLLSSLEEMGRSLVEQLRAGQNMWGDSARLGETATAWASDDFFGGLPASGDMGIRRAGRNSIREVERDARSWPADSKKDNLSLAPRGEWEESKSPRAKSAALRQQVQLRGAKESRSWVQAGGRSSLRDRGRANSPMGSASGNAGFLSGFGRMSLASNESLSRMEAGRYYGDPLAALVPALGAARAAPPTYSWSPEIVALLGALDRREAMKALAGNFRIAVETRYPDSRGREQSYFRHTLIGPDQWVDVGARIPGDVYPVGWHKDGKRGVVYEGWRFGRKRPSMSGDDQAWSAPFSWHFGDQLRGYAGYEAAILRVDGEPSVWVELSSPDVGSMLRIEIDVERNVVLSQVWVGDDGKGARQSFEAFVEVGGLWWPTVIRSFDADGKAGSVVAVDVLALEDGAFEREVAAELVRLENATVFGAEAIELEAAKQAVKDGTAGLFEHWRLLAYYLGSQRATEAVPHLSALESLMAGRPGLAPVVLTALAQSRRNAELKMRLHAIAEELEGSSGRFQSDVVYGLALNLLQHAHSLDAGSERMDLLQVLRPIFTRQEGRVAADLPWDRAMINGFADRGRPDELLSQRRQVAEKWPFEVSEQTAYASMLAGRQQVDEALLWLDRVEESSAPWQSHELSQLRSTRVQILWNSYRLEMLAEAVEAWDRADPTTNDSNLLNHYLSALTFLDRETELSRKISAWLEYAQEDKREPYEQARLHAAVQHALGQGHQLYHHRITDERAGQLRVVARSLAHREGDVWTAGWIIQSGQFRGTEDAKDLDEELYAAFDRDLEEMPVWQIQSWIGWLVARQSSLELDDAAWPRIMDRIYALWASRTETKERLNLASVIGSHGSVALRRRMFEQQLSEVTSQGERVAAAGRIFQLIVAEPWNEADQERAVALLSGDMAAPGEETWDEAARRSIETQRAIGVHDLSQWVVDGRVTKDLEAHADFLSMSRRRLQAESEKARTEASRAAVRLLAELEKAIKPDVLADWVSIERVYFTVRAGDEDGSTFDEALRLLGARVGELGNEIDEEDEEADGGAVTLLGEVIALRSFATCAHLSLRAGELENVRRQGALQTLVEGLSSDLENRIDERDLMRTLLFAWDHVGELENRLSEWFNAGEDIEKLRFGLDYAHLLAERGSLTEAVDVLESVDQVDELSGADYRMLAGWYTALDKPEDASGAKLRSYERTAEYELSQALYQEMSPYQRSGMGVPPDLDPEIPIRLRVLMKKAVHPQNYFWVAQGYYQATKDHRLLECLADAVIGHTAQGAYDFLAQVGGLAEQIHEEAAVDRVCEGIGERRALCDSATDRRALSFLEFLVVLRAGRQAHGTEAHEARCLEALRNAAIVGDYAEGELARMAAILAGPGRLEPESLSKEQLRQLRDLINWSTDPDERLTIGLHLARVEWVSDRRESAVLTLANALSRRRESVGESLGSPGVKVLPTSANEGLQTLSVWYSELGSFSAAEQLWRGELGYDGRTLDQRLWLRQQLYSVYRDAVREGGTLSIGKGQELYAAASGEMKEDLAKWTNEGHASNVISTLVDLWRVADGRFDTVDEDLKKFAFTELPPLLRLYQYRRGQSWVSQVANRLVDSQGPRIGLEFLIIRAENEPTWLLLRNEGFWSRHSGALISAIHKMGDLGPLDGRALALVLKELKEELRTRASRNRNGYDERYGLFWSAKRADFIATTIAFLEDKSALASGRRSGPAVAYAAEYLHRGLGASDEAVDALFTARRRGDLHLAGSALLCQILHEEDRFQESIVVLVELIDRQPQVVNHRVMLMLAQLRTGDLTGRDRTFAAAEAWYREHDQFDEGTIAALAFGCLNAELFADCDRLYGEAIPQHVRGASNRGVGDGVLATYYRHRSNALVALGRTVDAVDAAAGAIVSWGRRSSERSVELQNLVDVLSRAEDLEEYVAYLAEEVGRSGLENPIVRKALGRVYTQRSLFEKAAEQFRLGLAAAPDDAVMGDLLIQAFDSSGRGDLAAGVLLERTRRSGHDPADFVSLGSRYRKLGDVERSERAFSMLVEQWAHESEGRRALADLRDREGRYEESIEQWRHVARIRSKEPTGYLGLAGALAKVGRSEEAREVAEFLRSKTWPDHFSGVHEKASGILDSLHGSR